MTRNYVFSLQLPFGSSSDDYNLQVKGYSDGQLLFSNHTVLSFEQKSFSVFIQTDKSVYKPGQEVKIRIVTLHPDLKPYNTPVNIYIRVSMKFTWNFKMGVLSVSG